MVLRKRMGGKEHQRRHTEVLCFPDHPEERYADRGEDQGCHPGGIPGGRGKTEGQQQIERPDDPAYANSYFINANSTTAPGIVDADRQPIIDRSEVYSGVYGRASINLYAFNSNGNRGIACGLNNLQKIRDGEPLGGRTRAEDDFAGLDDDTDDFLD